MTVLFPGIDIEFRPKLSNKLVYCKVPGGFQISPLIIINNTRNYDVTFLSIKFESIPAGFTATLNYPSGLTIKAQTTQPVNLPLGANGTIKIRGWSELERVKFTFTIEEHTIATESNSVTLEVISAKGLSFFGNKADLEGGDLWQVGWRKHHNEIQAFAYDCLMARVKGFYLGDPNVAPEDVNENYIWYSLEYIKQGGTAEKNEDWLIWEKPIYSMTDGIVELVRNDSIDIKPEAYYLSHPDEPNLIELPDVRGGANEVDVLTSDNLLIRYAHFKQYSIPDNIRPGSTVVKGQKIGLVGTSGWTTGPHLHVDVLTPSRQRMSVKNVALDRGTPTPFSIKEKFMGNVKQRAKLSLLMASNVIESESANIPYYWPYPLTFTDCVFQNVVSKGSNPWTILQDSGPRFCTLDDSGPVSQEFGTIFPTTSIQICQFVVHPGHVPPLTSE